MQWVLHDWSDEECIQILKKCREAISNSKENGRVIIVEAVIDDHICFIPSLTFESYHLMLTYFIYFKSNQLQDVLSNEYLMCRDKK